MHNLLIAKHEGIRAPASRNIIKKPVVARPTESVRYDGIDHFPKTVAKNRCRLCKDGKTIFMCTKCNMRLCILKHRNCFYSFHKLDMTVSEHLST